MFLVVFQWGLYFAYKRDTTIVLDAFDADLWIVPKNQTMFDNFSSMDDLACQRARKVGGVQDVARIVWGDAAWRLPSSGGKEYIQVLGLDLDSSVATRFHWSNRLTTASLARLVRPDGCVLVGTQDRNKLGLDVTPDGPFEISGRQAFVQGYVDDVRLFTTAGFVLTNVRQCSRVPWLALLARQFYRLQMPPRRTTWPKLPASCGRWSPNTMF